MYQALYRKYRPTEFGDIKGQDVIVKTLQNAIEKAKISHAYLFTGPRGTGKTSIAKVFAKTINCENISDGSPCNKCVSCTQINNKKTVDVIEIDAASNNGVDEIRELKSKVALVPSVSKYKIYIIDEVHMLTTGAFNALLKTLEEPPAHVIFILATTEPQKIPSTILSRCQRYDFKKISISVIVDRLKYICEQEHIKIEEQALYEIARISDGGMRDSISILDQVISYKGENISSIDVHDINGTLTQEDLCDFMLELLNNNVEKVFELIDKYNNNGKNLQRLVDEIILFIRNLIMYKTVPKYLSKTQINISLYETVDNIVKLDKLYDLVNIFNELSNKMKYSSNPKITFEIEILRSMNISREIKEEKIIHQQPEKISKKEENNKKIEDKLEEKDTIISNEIINNIKEVRINNVLSGLDKQIINEVTKKLEDLKSTIINTENNNLSSLLYDGKIKAASNKGLIYVYEYNTDSDVFNNNLLELEKLIKNNIKEEYKLISVSIDEWNIIKNEFNNKKKQYKYEEEKFNLDEIFNKNNKKEVENMFDIMIEYTKEEL